jgi:hypothetical protein
VWLKTFKNISRICYTNSFLWSKHTIFDVINIPETAQGKFIEMINSTATKLEFSSVSETRFWVHRLRDYPALANSFKNVRPS